MTIIGLVPVLLVVGGGLVYLLPIHRTEVKQLAYVCFAVGLLVLTLNLNGHVVRIGGGL